MKVENRYQVFLHELKLFFALLKFGIKDINSNLIRILSDFVITIVRFGVTVWLYSYLFSYKGGVVMGVNLQTVSWGMFFYFIFMYISPRYLSTDIQKDIQTGKVEVILSKPVNYIFYKMGEYLGARFLTFFASAICGFLLMFFFLGIPENILTLHFLLTFPILILFCFVLTFEIFVILGMLSFWVEDIQSIRWLLDKSVMILGGAYLPVAFFPEILKKISIYTPIGASQFVTYSAYPNWSEIYLKMFGVQIFWIIVLGCVLYFIQKKAFARLSVNGG